MMRLFRSLGLFLLLLMMAFSSTSCMRLGPEFTSPIAPFAAPPATTEELAAQVEKYQPPIQTLRVELKAVAQGGNVGGKRKLGITVYYREPDNIALQVSHSIAGMLFRIYKRGDEVAIFDKEMGEFYRGTVGDLDAHPRALEGVHPMDIVRAELVSQELAQRLLHMPKTVKMTTSGKYWALSMPSSPTRGEVFLIRPSDGLVQEAYVYEGPILKVHVIYRSYQYFEGTLLPQKYELLFPQTNLRIRVELESARPNTDVPMTRFPLEPPSNYRGGVLPLDDYLRRMELQMPQQ